MGRPKKTEATKMAEADPGNLPWTESMDLCLLKLVNQFGAHLPHIEVEAPAAKSTTAAAPKNGAPKFHPKPADRWRDLTAAFFMADFLLLKNIISLTIKAYLITERLETIISILSNRK